MNQCPKCDSVLNETSVVVPKSDGSVRIIGMQKFCSNTGCNYEGEITR